MQTPDEWLADFEAKVADLQQKAARFKADIESTGTTRRSDDGAVGVTVAANGVLLDLTLADSAMTRPAADLAAEILALTRAARQGAADTVAEAFVPLGGTADAAQPIPPAPAPDATQATKPAPTRERRPDEDDFSDHPVVFKDEDTW